MKLPEILHELVDAIHGRGGLTEAHKAKLHQAVEDLDKVAEVVEDVDQAADQAAAPAAPTLKK